VVSIFFFFCYLDISKLNDMIMVGVFSIVFVNFYLFIYF
jgi:hypothetical protein